MDNQPISAVAARVSTPSGRVVGIPEGSRLVFGRGPDADLVVAAGRGLSRRAGIITAVAGGAWVANISQTHALYAEGDGYRIRLPRLDEARRAGRGLVPARGHALVGSRAMLDEGQPLRLVVAGGAAAPATTAPGPSGRRRDPAAAVPGPEHQAVPGGADVVPAVADRPAAATPLPRTPEIARAALEVTDAHHELERFDTDPAFRDRLSARVGEHLKVLRRKITERGLVRPGVRLSDEVAVRRADRERGRHRRRPGPAGRSGVVLPAGGSVVDAG